MLALPVYRSLFFGSPVPECLLSRDFTILEANEAYLNAAGCTREQLLGRRLFEAFPSDPDDPHDNGAAVLAQSLHRVLDTGRPDALPLQRYPIAVTAPDQSRHYEVRFWSVVNTPIVNAAGELLCIAHSCIDVTDLQMRAAHAAPGSQAEMVTRAQTMQQVHGALQAERSRLRHLFAHAPGFVYFTHGPQHIVDEANQAFLELMGVSEVVGRSLAEVFGEGEAQALLYEHDEVLRSGKPFRAQSLSVRLGNGTSDRVLDLVFQPILDDQGTPVGVCGQGIDITHKTEVQAQLRRIAQLQAFQLALADRIRTLDAPEDIVSTASEMLGTELDIARVQFSEVDNDSGMFFVRRDWVHPAHGLPSSAGQRRRLDEFGPESAGLLRDARLVQANDVRTHPLTSPHADAFARYGVRSVLALPLVKAGRLTAILSLHHVEPRSWSEEDIEKARDTAERTWAALEKAKAQAELREANRRKDEFLAMLAHELRNPLAPISAAAQLMELGRLDPARLKHTSQVISRQVKHMTGLVDDLLDVSRVTRGLVALDLVPQDIKSIVHNATEQVRPLMEAQKHRLITELPAAPAHVMGDAKRLVQILTNLLNNAAKYTPAGGEIHLSVTIEGDEVVTRVKDNGIGIAPELQPRVFELFVQAERTLDRSQGGLGLGLALVKSLVELHGGTVSCRSDGQDLGTCFTVRLPKVVREFAPVERRRGDRSLESAGGRLKVLVVDDNTDAAETLSMLLETSGHEVRVEHDGADALVTARESLPDVCLLDIGLPDMDGKDLARRLRAQSETANAVLIAITGYGQEQDRRSALEAGFDHHLVKPVDPIRLTALLNKIPVSADH